jgi:two-component system NtrC family sensor kinase
MAKERREKELPKRKPKGRVKHSSSTRNQRNILERKQQIQETLRQSEEYYRTLAEQSLVGIIVLQDSSVIFANDAVAAICGYSVEELLSLPPAKVQALVHPEDQPLVWGRLRDRLDGKAVPPHYQCRIIHKDGAVRWVEMYSNRIEYGGKPAIQAVIIDITEQKQAEEALRQSEERYRTILEEMGDGYFETDLAGNFIFVNDAMIRVLGYSKEEIIEMNYRALRPKKDAKAVFKAYNRIYKTGEPLRNFFTEIICKDGRHIFAETSAFSIRNDKGEIIGFRGVRRDLTERKKAAEALEKSEMRYRQLTENAGEAILVVQDNVIKFANPKGAELSGYSIEELVSRPFVEFIHPHDIDMVADRYARRLKGESVPQIYDFRIIRKDGAIRWGELNAVPISWEDRPAVLCFMSDITERKQAEEALRQSEERYRTILEEMEEGYYEVDLAGTFTFVNDAMSRILGYSRDELIGMNYKAYTPQEIIKTIFQAYNRVYRTGEPLKWYPMAEFRKDGTRILAEDSVFPLRNEKDEVIGFRGISRDVTERKQAEEALRQSEERYRTILDEMEDSYFEVDLGGHLTFVNNSTCRNLGYSREELLGMSYKNFTAEDDIESVFRVFNEVYQTSTPNKGFPWKTVRKDGAQGFAETSVSLLRDDKGDIIGFRGVGRDITMRKKVEEQLILTDRLASIGQLAGGIAHELNNPLTAIIGFSDLLLGRDFPIDVKEDLKTIDQEARRAVNIVKGLLAFAREQRGEKSLVDINTLIQGALQLRSYEQRISNIEVNAQLSPALPQVMGNGTQLQQVFMDIIVNAEQAMLETHGRGKITIVTEQVGDMIRTSITDDGPGISPDMMKQLFTPFFTTRDVGKGTGLGLSICHGIVTEHSGKIYAESESGEGATFVVELPISKE